MKKILFILLVMLLGILSGLQAQRVFEEDVIYLKDGSIIRGEIIHQQIGEYVKIEVAGGSVLMYSNDEIDRITREPSKYRYIKLKLHKEFRPFVFREKGFYAYTSMALGFSEGRWGPQPSFSIQQRLGYRFHRLLGVGGGTGFDFYEAGLIAPFFLDVNGDLLKRRISPHYLVNFGYGTGIARSWSYRTFNGGIMGQAALGIKMHTRSRNEWIFTLGYKFQNSYQEFEDWSQVWNNWDFTSSTFNVREAPIVRGTRLYQKINWQVTYSF